MNKFEDGNREIKDDGPMFKMLDIMWYKTENEVIPFVKNNVGTKIKVLTTDKIVKIYTKEVAISISPVDDDGTEIVDDLDKTLFKATRKKGGVVLNRIAFFKKYYFNDNSENDICSWLNSEIKTQKNIACLAEILTKNFLKAQEKITKDSRDF